MEEGIGTRSKKREADGLSERTDRGSCSTINAGDVNLHDFLTKDHVFFLYIYMIL